jgi:hypothetical protein
MFETHAEYQLLALLRPTGTNHEGPLLKVKQTCSVAIEEPPLTLASGVMEM